MDKKIILFVCTGNSCRSVIAEALFKEMLREAMESHPSHRHMLSNIEVLSAGVAPLPGMNLPPGTSKVLQEAGIDVSGHRAVSLTRELAKRSSLIVAMEKRHREEILDMAPGCSEKTILLGQFGQGFRRRRLDIADPIGHSLRVYRKCAGEIEGNLRRLLDDILDGKVKL
jgi:protein-tyrosine-phosphatase